MYIMQHESVRKLMDGIARYFRFYNTERFHQGLDYQIPDERYRSFQIVDLAKQAA
jgi:putative transposase